MDYYDENERLNSFTNWSKEHIISKHELAKSGFFYTGEEDKVKCFCCKLELKNWEPGDNVDEEHRTYSRIIQLEKTGYFSGYCAYLSTKLLESIEGIPPIHLKYSREADRLKTFENWSPSHCQKPEELVKAGFFSQNNGDRVRCFFCGGGLVSWEETDDPYKEHAKWFGRCKFIRLIKGDHFVNSIALHEEERSRRINFLNSVNFEQNISSSVASNQENNSLNTPNLDHLSFNNKSLKENCEKTIHFDPDKELEENDNLLKLKYLKLKDEKLCIICFNNERKSVFLPCGHLTCCSECTEKISKCPICRTIIKHKIIAIIS